ncbi:MAG TPA: GNAT family N-acetyltransferase [Dermatophilaceae bacterium]|nr:GNAT family N-acetyltransferase [Dermatophilaceae bacterium]
MSDTGDITVRVLGPDDWADFKSVRLEALGDSPEAFSATHDEEAAFDEPTWRARLERSPRFLASRDGTVVGTASLGVHESDDDFHDSGEIFGLWVTPRARGTGVATALAAAAAKQAQRDGRSHIVYWVSTDNGRAVAFASGLGFRPTDSRRPMRGSHHRGEEEIAMILALGEDRGMMARID